ncbi:hypothetical protein Ga0074812_13938 [Parafrankia irregularis]|uniref:Chromosome segregation ATPase n=1 Tax=Parafrankia irregularis TaxID=795642 RepID=A0A0S4QYN1_9ACTN|nr:MULTISPECIES: hypothetical protein [Parafrankia]CUU60404.1 hypothetical protein Ga0074812_13938 [Parafrankia irregularis]
MFELSKVRLHAIGPPGARFGDVLLDFSGVGAPVAGHRQDGLFGTDVVHGAADSDSQDTAPPEVDLPGAVAGNAVPGTTTAAVPPATPHEVTTAAMLPLPAPVTAVVPAQPSPAVPTQPLRPSPASVLFLENGGGKSVLMKLIFSVVLPGRRQVVGTSNGRVLDNFVLPRDCGHVVCEWQHAVTGERVVTGKVSEWRGRTTTDPSRLAEAWYSFRPRPGLDITNLPFVQDGRQVTFAGFRSRLAEAGAADQQLDLGWETNQGAWSERLDALGLDPELFRYQRAMNAGEGEAAEAFAFNSDEQFVDFLLRAVTPPEDPAGVADVVEGYAAKLAERAALEAEREFVAGALERLTPLVQTVQARAGAAGRLRELHGTVREAAAAVDARIALADSGTSALDERGRRVRTAVEEAERARARATGGELAARLRVAELRLAEAEATRDELVGRHGDAVEELEAWRAAEDVLRLTAADDETERLTRLVADAESRSAPALTERNAAARAFVVGLARLAAASRAEETRARAGAAAHNLAAESSAVADRAAADAAATTRAGAAGLRERRERADRLQAEAVRDGLLDQPGREPRQVAAEAARLADDARAAVRDALATAARSADHRQAQDAQRDAERGLDHANAELARLASDLDATLGAAGALTADGRIAALLGLDAGHPSQPGSGSGAGAGAGAGAAEPVDLDVDAEVALDALAAAVLTAEERQLALSVDTEADQRVLRALGDGDLRPARAAVGEVVAELERAGIPATAGWHHLANKVDEGSREQVLRARPDLVDGVVIQAGWDVDTARAVLDRARIRPDCAIVVGPARLLEPTPLEPTAPGLESTVGADGTFLVPPNPALYDSAAAAAERASIRRRHDERCAEAAELSARARGDRDLAAAVAGWRRTNPPGRIPGLRAAVSDAAGTVDIAARALADAQERVAAAARAAERAVAEVERLRVVEQECSARATALDQLVHVIDEAAGLTDEIARLEATAAEMSAEAEQHRASCAASRLAAQEALRRADDAARNTQAALTESASVVGAGDLVLDDIAVDDSAVDDSHGDLGTDSDCGTDGATDSDGGGGGGPVSPGAPPVQVPVLRAAYEAAERAYAQVEVGADLRGELDRAWRAHAAARAGVEGLSAAIRARCEVLLAGPDGGDATARATAQAATRRTAAELGRALDATRERLGGLRQELHHTAARVGAAGAHPMPPEDGPQSLEQALHWQQARADACREADADAQTAQAALDDLIRDTADHERERDAFGLVAGTLSDLLADAESTGTIADGAVSTTAGPGNPADRFNHTGTGDHTGPGRLVGTDGQAGATIAPFDGDAAAAAAMTRELRATWRQAVAAHAEAAGRVRVAADAVASWAAGGRFEAVRTPARRQMVRAGRDAVAANAEGWAAALAPRLRSLDDDLAHIGRNRAAIVARLEGMVRASLGTLRSAQRLSRLPDQLGDWSGQEFLRITFAEPDPVALTEALGEVVDAAASGAATNTGTGTGGSAARTSAPPRTPGAGGPLPAGVRRDGMTLLVRGVRAALPGGVRVEILKPDAVLRTERVRISQLGDVFSGGQQLTAAIILYCTMAALRANDRGRLRARHAGVLFLDNPIGRASASYLLDLQLAVADRLGVQLIYTTGLFDTTALSAFRLVIRLRNDADLRAGMKYLRVQERLLAGLVPPRIAGGTDAAGMISAARVFRRNLPGSPPAPAGAGAGAGAAGVN